MTHISYPYKLAHPSRYSFISIGRKRIEKVVDFVPLGIYNLTNMGFGDLSPDGSIDDKANSNNGDIVKVLATVVEILKHFTNQYPQTEIYFEGSTVERTILYERILKTYYHIFSKEFQIGCIAESDGDINVIPYEPNSDNKYLAFLIKRIS
jgi:hypothetical protein